MIFSVALISLLLGLANAMSDCPGAIFFGEDENPDMSGTNPADPLLPPDTTNADIAFAAFTGSFIDPLVENFESFTPGDTDLALDFDGCAAELSGGTLEENTFNINGQAIKGRFAISGTQYYATNDGFTISFTDEAVIAFGFYGVDVGDFNGQLVITVTFEDDTTCEITVAHSINIPSGSVIYFGYLDPTKPFKTLVFSNDGSGFDRFAFDDFTIAKPDEVKCENGILNADGTVCCDGDCGACGGCDCDMNPGGAALCCPGTIAASGFECLLNTDVACLCGDYLPSNEGECL